MQRESRDQVRHGADVGAGDDAPADRVIAPYEVATCGVSRATYLRIRIGSGGGHLAPHLPHLAQLRALRRFQRTQPPLRQTCLRIAPADFK